MDDKQYQARLGYGVDPIEESSAEWKTIKVSGEYSEFGNRGGWNVESKQPFQESKRERERERIKMSASKDPS